MFVVVLLLPAVLRIFDPIILRTTMGFKGVTGKNRTSDSLTQI
jgi:hypothetical protein